MYILLVLRVMACLMAMIRFRYPSGPPSGTTNILAPQILPFLSVSEVSHFTNALSVFTLLLKLSPKDSYAAIESDVLPILYPTAVSSLPSGVLQDTLAEFFSALVKADPSIASRLVLGLMNAFEKSAAGSSSAANTARFIGAVVAAEPSLAVGTIKDFAGTIKVQALGSDATY